GGERGGLRVQGGEGGGGLLPLVEPAAFGQKALQEIVAALKQRPEAAAETLLTDLTDEAARSTLAALLVRERDVPDVGSTIQQFARLLDRMQRLRRMRELGRSIAELQEMQGVQAVPEALPRALVEDGTVVHEMVGGGPRPLDNGPPGP